MRVVCASAHRLHLWRSTIVAARSEHQKLLNQARTRTTRRGCLGVLFHFIEREQPFFFDRFGDDTFAHTIAAAHFIAVLHLHRAGVAFVADVTNV